ncbi:MAG: helix-turn-helix transcriptional regulator, partial [Pseudonocardia sp.]|nr:helix-turn-helix transcriptional regulator [Pseudonocardia sp.]
MSGPPTVSSESGSRPGVLRTKLAAPGLRPGLLPRTALLDQLDAVVVPGRLSLMVAGAGWGKSTLLAQWHQRDSRPECFAWFCVDTDDNDPRRFWAHVLAAVAPLGEGLTALSTQLLMTPGTNIVDDVAPALINELTTVGVPATLVVDDYHLISNTEIHAAMAVLAAHVPRTLRLVISGRSQPPLPLTRLRGSGRLVDINVEELRLSADETRELIKRELPGRLTSEEIALLHERTEGWVTGLHLAVLSLRRHPDPERLIREFAGTDRNIGDYLLTEVLEQQPPDVRSFLRATSILKRFSAPLANAVTARADSVDL